MLVNQGVLFLETITVRKEEIGNDENEAVIY